MFVTTNVLDRRPIFADPACAREAIECLYRVQSMHPFLLYAFVIMPDHCHILMQVLPPNTVSKIMTAFKSGLTFDIGVPKLWQPRFYVRIVEKNIEKVISYVHQNPVKAGLCDMPQEYLWSSAYGKWDVSEIG